MTVYLIWEDDPDEGSACRGVFADHSVAMAQALVLSISSPDTTLYEVVPYEVL